MHGQNQDGVCHVLGDKHGDECIQNLKQQEDLSGRRKLKCPEHLFIGTKAFMKATMRIDAFLIYVLPSLNVEPRPHQIPS
jgi:hypothetical protein